MARTTSDHEAIANLRALGVGLMVGDLKNPNFLSRASENISAFISTATTICTRQPDDSIETADRQGQLNLVHAAKVAGVQSFVYISYSD